MRCGSCGATQIDAEGRCASCGPESDSGILLRPLGNAGTPAAAPTSVSALSLQNRSAINEVAVISKTAIRGWNTALACHICEGCFAQDVKDALKCYRCGATFLIEEEAVGLEAKRSKNALGKVWSDGQATTTHAGVIASDSKLGRSLRDYSLGWILIAGVIVFGGVAVKLAMNRGQHRDGAVQVASVAPPPTPIPAPPNSQGQFQLAERLREANQDNARLQARNRALLRERQRGNIISSPSRPPSFPQTTVEQPPAVYGGAADASIPPAAPERSMTPEEIFSQVYLPSVEAEVGRPVSSVTYKNDQNGDLLAFFLSSNGNGYAFRYDSSGWRQDGSTPINHNSVPRGVFDAP